MTESTAVEVAEVISGDVVPHREVSSLVALSAPINDIVTAQQQYLEVCTRLLDANDIQVIGKKEFKKRSAWNKLAVAFGISTQVLSTTHERDDRGRIIRTECVVRAIAPNGRISDGIGACDLYERCCDPDTCTKWLTYPDSGKPTGHTHCSVPCRTAHFSNPQHDIPATAFTRASNRAKADLFGMGEVSAEEVVASASEANTVPARLPREAIGSIGALFESCGMTDPTDRKAFVIKTVGRTPDRIADLSPSEAADLIAALQEIEEPF